MSPIPALDNLDLLVVDVELVAVAAGTDRPALADVALSFDIHGRPDTPWLGLNTEPTPFAQTDSLAAGVHLHWQLPAGLTRGQATYTLDQGAAAATLAAAAPDQAAAVSALLPLSADTRPALARALTELSTPAALAEQLALAATSSTVFPDAPNRWLVQRWNDPNTGTPDAAWVVESDALWRGRVPVNDPCAAQNVLSRTVLMLPTDRSAVLRSTTISRRLGRVFPAAGWVEGATGITQRLAPFTAVGYGHPAFAAALPHCYNVFGVLDPLPSQTTAATYSYTVVGWYADPALDPTAHADTLDFTVPEGTSPARTVLRARTRGVGWQPATAARTASACGAAIGTTTADAAAALLGAGASSPAAAEQYLEVLQLGLVANLNEARAGVLKEWDDALRAAEYGGVPGGTAWTVKPASHQDEPIEATVPVPSPLVADVDALNDAQARLDTAVLGLAGVRRQLFADWCLFVSIATTGKITDDQLAGHAGDRNNGRLRLAGGIDAVGDGAVAVDAARLMRDARRDDLLERMISLGYGETHVLQPGPAANFHHPSDPVLILAGPDVGPPAAFTPSFSVQTLATAIAYDATVTTWDSPWRPLLLEWQAQYQACDDAGTVDASVSALTLSGVVILHRQPLADLVREAGDLPGLQAPAASQSQALGGLTTALLGRRQSIELPVLDPNADTAADWLLGLDVAAAVGREGTSGVVENPGFVPVRCGRLTVTRLGIIDSFGRPLAMFGPGAAPPGGSAPVTSIVPSLRMAPPAGATIAAGVATPAFLPRRLVQPARLTARWLPGDRVTAAIPDPASDTAASPIFGWLLVNRLDRALAIYAADGTPLGSLSTTGVLWQSAPGPLYGLDWDAAVPPGPLAELIGGLVAAIGDDTTRAYLGALISAIDDASKTSLPTAHAEHPGLSLLIGRPLALVRGAIGLELAGPPAIDQGLDRFRAAPAADAAADGGVTTMTVPVTVGMRGLLDDGLVGYFIDSGGGLTAAPGPSAFFSGPAGADNSPPAWAQGASAGVYLPDPSLTAVSVATPPVRVTMLIDPRSPVHLDAALLPVSRLKLEPAVYTPVLEGMSVTFPVGPLISAHDTGDGIRIPLPDEPGYAWTLGLRVDSTWTFLATAPVQDAMTALAERQSLYEGWLRLAPDAKGDDV